MSSSDKNINKTLYLIGGVNGAGKSTFVDNSFGQSDINIINVDRMAYEIGGDYSTKSNIRASKEALKILQNWPKSKKSLVWETVLGGNQYNTVITNFRKFGYQVDLTYIFLEDEETHRQRIQERVRNGGHDIPPEDIARRFNDRSKNFFAAIGKTDNWRLICNQNPWFEFVAFGHYGEIIVSNREMFELFKNPPEYDPLAHNIFKQFFGFFANIVKSSQITI